jgi:hypothetical protein
MIEDAKRFLADWISENVNAEAYEPEGDNTRARELAAECLIDAEQDGLSAELLDAAAKDMIGGGSNLVELIAKALESATDDEIERLVAKDN